MPRKILHNVTIPIPDNGNTFNLSPPNKSNS